jgi:hypothetical protein
VLQGRALVRAPERVQGLSVVRVQVLAAVQQVRVPALVLARPEQVPERVPAEPLWAADHRRTRQWRWRG